MVAGAAPERWMGPREQGDGEYEGTEGGEHGVVFVGGGGRIAMEGDEEGEKGRGDGAKVVGGEEK